MEYRYSGEERVYVDRALVVSDGDVVDWPEPPDDGHWTPVAPGEENKAPDNGSNDEQHENEPPADATTTTEAPADAVAQHTEE